MLQGKYDEAEPFCKHILDIKEKKLDSDDPVVDKWIRHLVYNLVQQVRLVF